MDVQTAQGGSGEPRYLFCAGAQKAGTTWLYDYFSDHPEVHVPPVKEMHYFTVRWDKNQSEIRDMRARAARRSTYPLRTASRWLRRRQRQPGEAASPAISRQLVAMHDDRSADHAAYRAFMTNGAGRATYVADISPDYSVLGANSYVKMHQAFNGAKFIFIMRDPVARTWSNIRMHSEWMKQRGHPELTTDELLRLLLVGRQNHILLRSNYSGTLFALGHLPPSDVLVLFYEELFCDETMQRLCDFLGVGFVPGNYSKRVRAGRNEGLDDSSREILRWLLAPVYRQVFAKFGDSVPDAWDRAALNATIPQAVDAGAISPQVLERAG